MSDRRISMGMASAGSSHDKPQGSTALWTGISLPLVSVVITNYNYGRYLRDAVESARAQSYPNVECLIVDDASTDESPSILAALESEFPDLKIIRKDTNSGQIPACCTGFEASGGDYVIFLDADDVLLPAAVETHAYVHLSARVPVGMTTSDMMQSVNGRLVRGCDREIGAYVRSERGSQKTLLCGIDLTAPALWAFDHLLAKDIAERVHLLQHVGWDEWIYAPTSGNCFRRDAVAFILDQKILTGFKLNVDTYLNRFVCLLHGGILIDVPLSVYRIHTANGFIFQAAMVGVLHYDRERLVKADLAAWQAAVRVLIDDAGRIYPRMEFHHYSRVLERLARASVYGKANSDRIVDLGADCAADYILDRLVSNEIALRALVGREHYRSLLRSIEAVRTTSGVQPSSWWRQRCAEFLLTLGRLTQWSWLTLQGEQVWRG